MLGHELHDLGRGTHREVVQVVPVVVARVVLELLGEVVHDELDRRVPDGVEAHLPSHVVRVVHDPAQPFRVDIQ